MGKPYLISHITWIPPWISMVEWCRPLCCKYGVLFWYAWHIATKWDLDCYKMGFMQKKIIATKWRFDFCMMDFGHEKTIATKCWLQNLDGCPSLISKNVAFSALCTPFCSISSLSVLVFVNHSSYKPCGENSKMKGLRIPNKYYKRRKHVAKQIQWHDEIILGPVVNVALDVGKRCYICWGLKGCKDFCGKTCVFVVAYMSKSTWADLKV